MNRTTIFYAIMWTIAAVPILLLGGMLFVSALAYDILRRPERQENSNRIWNYVATDVYYSEEANIWQNQKECVQFDALLLYKPSLGCSFANPEFSTQLTFSEDGRISENERKSLPNRAIILAGDSVTMGWGVNDNETFGHLIGSQIDVPVFNLGVSSYGTVREIMRARMHFRFADANCIILQYHWNDFEENETFATFGELPKPTAARFQELFEYRPKTASLLDVILQTQKYMLRYPLDFVADLLGLRNFPPWQRLLFGRRIVAPNDHADVFMAVVKKFPELSDKIIFLIGPDDFVNTMALRSTQENVIPLKIEASIYTLDRHPNKKGHQQIAAGILEALRQNKKGEQCLFAGSHRAQ